jgi:nicotinate-nucleotide adenylyltransferase
MKKKIGIYSGVFDPVHHGHISFAEKALHELGLDKVYFLVEPEPRRKPHSSGVRHRLNMVWLALREHKDLELLPLDHPTFSVKETLAWLEEKFEDAELHLLMGTDLFQHLPDWPGFDSLKSRVKFVVGQRGQMDSSQVPIEHQAITAELPDLASSDIRQLPAEEMASAVPDNVAKYIKAEQLYLD